MFYEEDISFGPHNVMVHFDQFILGMHIAVGVQCIPWVGFDLQSSFKVLK